ncbi:uncharacterized protein LOC120599612 [Pteropus medius]|uniref:uncharacterized protein LOC120599612 n=1 Tax=Pteropus vampyrus TaxID=132908 RepID=UPI00196A4AEA|nr:uncharacterized protein LOC120599612 [Pteropus giganteus]
MNHPPFPPPGLLSGLLRPRPQWPASGRSSTAPAPRAVRLRLKPLPAAGPARPASWGLDPGRSRSNRTACGVAPHGRASALEPTPRPQGGGFATPTNSLSAPPKLKAEHPSLPPTGELKAQGLARSRSVHRDHSLLFTDGNCGPERSLPESHRHTRRGLHQDLTPPDLAPPWALHTATGASWQEARPVVSECGALSPALKGRSDHPAPGQSWRLSRNSRRVTPEPQRVPAGKEAEACREKGTCSETPRLWRA